MLFVARGRGRTYPRLRPRHDRRHSLWGIKEGNAGRRPGRIAHHASRRTRPRTCAKAGNLSPRRCAEGEVKKPKKPEAPVPCDPKDLLDELEALTSAKMSE